MRTIAVFLIAAACAAPVSAQELPDRDGSWKLEMSSSGGITGLGAGSYLVTSAGEITCTRPATCASRLSEAQLHELTELIASAASAAWGSSASGVCSDCYRIALVLRRREQGSVRTYRAEWDEPAPATPEMVRIYRTVVRLNTGPAN